MSHTQAIPREARRERVLVLLALGALTLLAWGGTVALAEGHAHVQAHGHAHPPGGAWTGEDVPALLVMWAVMMSAMMLPSIVPTVLVLASAGRPGGGSGHPLARGLRFVGGYLAVWVAFGALAALAQSWLQAAGLLSHQAQRVPPLLGAGLLLAAGAFQFTPMKEACRARCRAFGEALSAPVAAGGPGAFRRGLAQGASSAGSCWALMLVPFVTGVMSMPAMVLLTGFLLVEHLAPGRSGALSRAAGACLVAWGGWVLFV